MFNKNTDSIFEMSPLQQKKNSIEPTFMRKSSSKNSLVFQRQVIRKSTNFRIKSLNDLKQNQSQQQAVGPLNQQQQQFQHELPKIIHKNQNFQGTMSEKFKVKQQQSQQSFTKTQMNQHKSSREQSVESDKKQNQNQQQFNKSQLFQQQQNQTPRQKSSPSFLIRSNSIKIPKQLVSTQKDIITHQNNNNNKQPTPLEQQTSVEEKKQAQNKEQGNEEENKYMQLSSQQLMSIQLLEEALQLVCIKKSSCNMNIDLSNVDEEDSMTSFKNMINSQEMVTSIHDKISLSQIQRFQEKHEQEEEENKQIMTDINAKISQIRRSSELNNIEEEKQELDELEERKQIKELGDHNEDNSIVIQESIRITQLELTKQVSINYEEQETKTFNKNLSGSHTSNSNIIQNKRRRTTRILLSLELQNLSDEFQRISNKNDKERYIKPNLKLLKDQNILEVNLCEKDETGNIIKIMEKTLNIKIYQIENPQYNWKISNVMIGSGVYGRVYKAFDEISKKEYALKIVEFKDFESKQFADLINEIFILNKLAKKENNNFFIKLYDNYIICDDNQTFKKLVLVEELCQCNLYDIINFRREKNLEWREEELQGIFIHLLKALEQVQIQGVCHRDLKPQNILFSANQMQFKIGDFSEGKYLQEIPEEFDESDKIKYESALQKNIKKKRHTIRGTPLFMSPQLKKTFYEQGKDNLEYSPFQSDLYSMGITFMNMSNISQKLNQKNLQQVWEQFSEEKEDQTLSGQLIQNLIQIDEDKRLSYQETKQKIGDIKIDLKEDAKIADCIDNYKLEDKQTQYKIRLIIAEGYQKLCKFKEALDIYKQFVKEFQGLENKEDLSEAYYNMGKIHSIFLQKDEAKNCFEEALLIRVKLFGNMSVQCGEIYSALGFLSKNQHDFKSAKSYYERSLQIALNQQGERSALVGEIYNSLGSLEIQFGNYDNSKQYLLKSLNIIKEIFGEKSNQYNDIQTNLAIYEINMKQFASAKLILLQTYDECIKLKGANNPDLILKLINLSIIDTEENNFVAALEKLQKALWIAEKFYKKKSLQYVEILNSMFHTLKMEGNLDKAFDIAKQAQDIIESISNNHPMLIYIYSNLAEIFSKKKLFDKGIVALKNAKKCFDRNPLDPKVNADLCYNLGITLYQTGKWDEGIKFLKEAKSIYEQRFPDNQNSKIILELISLIENKN